MGQSDHPHGIMGLKNSLGMPLDPSGVTTATPASIEHGVLEWIIPNNQFNQNQISQYYSKDYTILAAGTERKHGNVVKMANMPEPLDAKETIIKPLVADPILTPVEPVAQEPVANTLGAAEARAEAIMKARKLLADVDAVEDAPSVMSPDVSAPATPTVVKTQVRATNKITLLKAELTKKLSSMGVKVPKNASLPKLEAIMQEKLENV